MPFHARFKRIALTTFFVILAPPLFAQGSFQDGFFTTSDQVKLHYVEAGRGETLLFIPGWLMPADIWELQLKEFSKDYHVVALDPRSQGQSDMTPQGDDPLRRSRDVSELLEHLHINSVVLVGWSLGAFDILAYLRQFGTAKVNAMVLVDSPLGAPSGVSATPKRSAFLQLFENDREKAGRSYVWSLFKKPPSLPFYKKLTESVSRIPTDIALATLDHIRPGEVWQPNFGGLREVSILYAITPTYASQAAYLKQVAPQTRVELFENTGHALFVDQAARFNALLKEFLRQSAFYPAGLPESRRRAVVPPGAIPQAAATLSPPVASNPTPTVRPRPTKVPTLTPLPVFQTNPEAAPQPTALPGPTTPVSIKKTPQPIRHTARKASANPVKDGFFITSDHVRLHYLEAGQGLALVFVPGWLLPAEIWRPQLEGLSQDYHVIALDPRSQGDSEITPQGDEPVRQAKDIQELLDHLQLNSVVLVGWSHGGFQILAYLNQFGPDRLYAMVLVDSALAASSTSSTGTSSQARFLEQFKNDRVRATRGFIWGLFKRPPPSDFTKRLNEAAARTPTDIALALMNNVFPGDSWQPSIPVMRQVPLLYAVTRKYSFQANYLTQVDPQARVEFFDNAGHALFVDESEHFNATLRDFLHQVSLYPGGWPRGAPKPKATMGPIPAQGNHP